VSWCGVRRGSDRKQCSFTGLRKKVACECGSKCHPSSGGWTGC